jgi:membrane protein YqaA with SNARE-associated domain
VKELNSGIKSAMADSSKPGWIYWILFAGAFADASIWPFPVATLFITAIFLFPEKPVKIILLSTLGTLLGAMAGYFTGRFAWIGPEGDFTRLAQFTFEHVPGFSENAYERAGNLYSGWYIRILFLGSFTPIPFGIFAVTSGVFERPFLLLVTITAVSHILKYSLLAFLAVKSGIKVLKYLKKRKGAVITVALGIIALLLLTALAD